ncbi:MAG: hypothetical protein IPI17_15920 [Nitrosomonas sp.]|nr:hypothetical protein [Nitrosomonas sp.]
MSDRIKRDMRLELKIQLGMEDNFRVYGARKVWRPVVSRRYWCCSLYDETVDLKKLGIQKCPTRQKCWTTISDVA